MSVACTRRAAADVAAPDRRDRVGEHPAGGSGSTAPATSVTASAVNAARTDSARDALRGQVRAAAGRDPDPSAAVLDAQTVKSSEGGPDRGFDAGKKTTGRKRHLIVDTLGLLLVVMVTAASVQDRPGGRTVLARLAARFPSIGLVWADGGYANSIDSTLVGWAKDKLGLLLQIVKRSDDVKDDMHSSFGGAARLS